MDSCIYFSVFVQGGRRMNQDFNIQVMRRL